MVYSSRVRRGKSPFGLHKCCDLHNIRVLYNSVIQCIVLLERCMLYLGRFMGESSLFLREIGCGNRSAVGNTFSIGVKVACLSCKMIVVTTRYRGI